MPTSSQLTWERLVAIARRVGVKVVEAPSSHRGKLGTMGSVAGVTEHTTGTPNSFNASSDYPDFNVVKEGRTGLVNSLSAYGIGRREAIYVFSEFLSWHAGAWLWQGITDGNGHFLGIECAGVGDYTEFQRKVYPRLVAAILLDINSPRSMAARHLDGAVPKGRKPDAQGFDGDFYQGKSFNQWVDFFLANPAYININYQGGATAEEDDDMKLLSFRSDPTTTDQNGTKGTGAVALMAPGFVYVAQTPSLYDFYVKTGICTPFVNLPHNLYQHLIDVFSSTEKNDQETLKLVQQLKTS